MKNNKGFTLVELIISIAIFAVVSTSVLSFTVASTNTYKGISTDLGIQFESQMIMGQIQEYLLDCNGGVSFNNNILSVVNREEDDTLTAYFFRFDEGKEEGEGKLWYSTSKVTKEADGTIYYTEPTPDTESLAADLVNGFAVKLTTNLQGNTIAKVTLSFSKGTKHYTGEQYVYIRNKVKTNSEFEALLQQLCKE